MYDAVIGVPVARLAGTLRLIAGWNSAIGLVVGAGPAVGAGLVFVVVVSAVPLFVRTARRFWVTGMVGDSLVMVVARLMPITRRRTSLKAKRPRVSSTR